MIKFILNKVNKAFPKNTTLLSAKLILNKMNTFMFKLPKMKIGLSGTLGFTFGLFFYTVDSVYVILI